MPITLTIISTADFVYKTIIKLRTEGEHLHEIKEDIEYHQTVCYHCNKKFQNKGTCKQHIKYSHNIAPYYKCDQCDAKYTSNAAKEYHIRTVHNK